MEIDDQAITDVFDEFEEEVEEEVAEVVADEPELSDLETEARNMGHTSGPKSADEKSKSQIPTGELLLCQNRMCH